MNIADILEVRVKSSPERAAFIFKGCAVNFRELRGYSFRLANHLLGLGLKKGDRVAIYLPNSPEYIYSYLSSWCAGATAVPLDFMFTEEELISCIVHSEAKVLIIKPKPNFSLEGLKEKCPSLEKIIVFQEAGEPYLSLGKLLETGEDISPAVEIQDKDYAIIFYTSGTTGKPKGVLTNYLQLEAPPRSMEYFVDLNEKDIVICAIPLSHLGGLVYLQNNIYYGVTMILMERFIPIEFLKNVSHYRVTCFWLVPSMYYAILQLKEFETYDLSSLRWIVSFGASSAPAALRRFHQYCPKAHFLNGWGLTETNAPTSVLPMGSLKIESVGRPAPWIEIKIFDEVDKEIASGDVGEVVVRSWVVSDGYYKDPLATAEALRNGWFHTGDLGKFDAEGHLYIVGRKKEMIKVGGEIVFEPEVEAAIYKEPHILEAAVVGVPDTLRGEVPKAFVVLKEGFLLSEEDLRYFCRQHLAHFKIPHYFEFRQALPKTGSGKVDKEKLRGEPK